MIVTVRFEGVLADWKQGTPITAARAIPQGLALVEAFSERFPLHVLIPVDAPRDHAMKWLERQVRWTAIPWVTNLKHDEMVVEAVLQAMGLQSTVLFHVDADLEVVNALSETGISAFCFREAQTSYPRDVNRRAFEALYP